MACRTLSWILLFLVSAQVRAGLPVIDTNELVKEINDGIFLFSAIDNLLSEAGLAGVDQNALSGLNDELTEYRKTAIEYQSLKRAVDDASVYDSGRSAVFADQVTSITRHLRKLKTVVSIATSIRARPGALKAALEVLDQDRQRERDKFNLAMKALEEREKVRKHRYELLKRTRLSQALETEINDIEALASGKSVRPIRLSAEQPSSLGSLW